MRKNVAVIFGGISCENEISVITGTMAANLIDSEKYAVHPVYIAQNGEMYKSVRAPSFRAENCMRCAAES